MTDYVFTLKARNGNKMRGALLILAVVVLFAASAQIACSKKVNVALEDTGPVRVIVLPFMVSSEKPGADKELQWAAMAAPALLIKTSRRLPDIEIVPFWEVMPVAVSVAGAARSFTDEDAASAANWLSAQWAVMGEVRGTGSSSSYSVVVDFIPTGSNTVPFRHIKTRRMESFGTNFYLGLRQWLGYATARTIPLRPVREPGLQDMRRIGEALDKEYGWTEAAEPGGAQAAVDEILLEDETWAKLMFRSTLYPVLAEQQPKRSSD